VRSLCDSHDQAAPLRRGVQRIAKTLATAVLASLVLAASASAFTSTPGPGWVVSSRSYPTNTPPGGTGSVEVDLYNIGAGSTSGTVTVEDKLPPGLTATSAGGLQAFGYISETSTEETEHTVEEEELVKGKSTIGGGFEERTWTCKGTTVVICKTRPGYGGVLRPIPSGAILRLGIFVSAAAGASGTAPNEVTASGGGTPGPATSSDPLTISSAEPAFGFAGADAWYSNADGTMDTQAGSHPFEATFTFDLNQYGELPAGGALRNLSVELPAGLVGNTGAVPKCTRQQFLSALLGGCPATTQIGVDKPELPGEGPPLTPVVAVYNLVPPPGVPAEFGFTAEGANILLDAEVRSGSDYGITEAVHALSFKPVGNAITIWGVPSDPVHDRERCGKATRNEAVFCGVSDGGAAKTPFLTVPTSCEGPLSTRLTADTWTNDAKAEASYLSHNATGAATGFTGCENLGFGPTMSVAPDTTFAETPAGLSVELKVPQEGLVNPEGLASSNIKDTTVTLPEGVAVNPGQARGLLTCSMAQSAVGTEAAPTCPSAAKVGTDEIATPLLANRLEGNVYVLDSNPPNLKLLVVASGEGVNLKLVGNVHLDEATGRLTTTFKETPELPFTMFKLSFSGGSQAALTTPSTCGTYETTSDFTPWSTPSVSDVFPISQFLITGGPNGSSCAQQPFAPTLIAGATTDQAGGYTSFSLLLSRPDGQQRIEKLQFKTPEGLLGMISHVTPCQEPQAAAGSCPAASQIGHTTVEAGPGSAPLVVPEPGQAPAPIYLTGPYKGAPFGLSIAVPVIAGPFNLGTVVVRGSIAVDPNSTQLTITTDPLPSILDGVPTDLRVINAVIDHPGFMINPTNCSSSSFSGTAWGTPAPGAGGVGETASISSRFGVGSCRSLTFKPSFSVITKGHASRNDGSSLTFKLGYPKDAMGSQSWFNEARFDIPKQLPARLSTIQQACLAATFEHERSKCPKHSIIGHALVHTPVLPVPLEGPVYFVSYGGAKFPDAVVVLDGDNVHVELHGNTFINGKTGVTSATFKALPDVPFESIEVSLPTGEYSEFGANLPAKAKDSFCGQKLTMPTFFKAQNGLEIKQSTKLVVTGCPKAKKASNKHAKSRKGKQAGRSSTRHARR
jgi:hypothetical protein